MAMCALPACDRSLQGDAREAIQPAGASLDAGRGDEAPLRRQALHAPAVMVEGRGAFADGLLERVRADLASGWHGAYVVPEGCAEQDCLHWWAASADGTQRIEQLPEVQVAVVVPEAGELHVDPGIVLAHARQVGERLFPGAVELEARYYSYAGRTSNRNVTLVLNAMRDGSPVHVEIPVGMWMAWPEAPVEGEDRRIASLHASVRSMPLAAFEDGRMPEWSGVRHLWLEREGWDAQLDECVGKAMMIRYMAYIGADEDADKAQDACHAEWETRKLLRAQPMIGAGPQWP